MRRWAMLAAASLLLALPARASEDLVSGLSQDTVQITSNYTGADIVVFGAIEHLEDSGANDVVVVVRGPDADVTVHKKDNVLGIWIARDQAKLMAVPAYYYLSSTRPVDQIAAKFTLSRYEIGLQNIAAQQIVSHHEPEPFRQAFIRHMQQGGLYGEQLGVEFSGPTLFHTHVPLPAEVPTGQYNVEVYLFRDGNVISAQSTPLYIDQAGLERRLYNFAHLSPLSYGLSTVLMAVLLGWLSSLVFRRAD